MTLKRVASYLTAAGVALSLGACGSDSGSTGSPPPSRRRRRRPRPLRPEPPSQPTGMRVTDRGEDFVEWSWDPVEGATSYEADVFVAGTPAG